MEMSSRMNMQIPTFIDFEASSLDLIASYPIEVGVCMSDGTLLSWLIKPHVLWQDWSESAQRIHGITREELAESGVDIGTVAADLNRLLQGPVYCDAWTFDAFWLHRLFRAANCKPLFQLESISMLLNPTELGLWSGVRRELVRELALDMHRAANDALVLQETWKRVNAARSHCKPQNSL